MKDKHLSYLSQHPNFSPRGGKPLAGGGDPPHDDGMEARVAKLEDTMTDVRERLARIETKIDSTFPTLSTKTDMADLRADIASMEMRLVKWFVSTAVVLAALAFTAAHFIS